MWQADVVCDGSRAEDRAKWLVKHKGMGLEAARQMVMAEFPGLFNTMWNPDIHCGGHRAEDRAQWLMREHRYQDIKAAQRKVMAEFPEVFQRPVAPPAAAPPAPPPTRHPVPADLARTAGVCYSPFHNTDYPPADGAAGMARILDRDFALLRPRFAHVRTYCASYYGVPVAAHAARAGLRLALGVHMNDGPMPYPHLAAELAAAAAAGRDHPEAVEAIYVGNENLRVPGAAFGDRPAAEIAALVRELRGKQSRPVGTAQRINEWLAPHPDVDELAAAVDVIGANVYPFFTPGPDPPGAKLAAQWEKLRRRFPDHAHKLRLTETGWPTAGGGAAGNAAGHAAAAAAFGDYLAWAGARGAPSYYFMAFDRRARTVRADKAYEEFLGLATARGKWKFT